MYRISLLLFVFLCGCLNQAGSLVLTSSPLTTTDREVFTLICSSNTTGGRDRLWLRDSALVITTTRGSSSPSVSDPNIFNRYLSGRVTVSCDATQHNVTLRINSTVDNGSVWQCVDNVISQRSNTMAINVTAHQTTITTASTYSASVTTATATATNIAAVGSTDINVSSSSSPASIEHNTTSTTTTTTTYTTTKGNTVTTSGPIEDINVSSSSSPASIEHNTTSTTTTTITYTTTKGNTVTTSGPIEGQSNTIAIAAGAAGGSVAVIAVVVVTAICIRKRRRSVEEDAKDKTRRDINPSRSAEMLIESGIPEEGEKVMQDNILYTSSSDVAPVDSGIEDQNAVGKDVYTQVKKEKTNADQQEITDVYAKPHKGRQETPNGDVYAKVNKVKSREGTSENIEDMYAKPQKTKRNLKSNADAD